MTPSLNIAFTIGVVILVIGLPVAFFMPFIQPWIARKQAKQPGERVRSLEDQINDDLWGHLDRKYWHEQVGPLTDPPAENPSEG